MSTRAKRGIAPQTLRAHKLAYDERWDRWLIPFNSPEGNVVNLQLYYSNHIKPNKRMLPALHNAHMYIIPGKPYMETIYSRSHPVYRVSEPYIIEKNATSGSSPLSPSPSCEPEGGGKNIYAGCDYRYAVSIYGFPRFSSSRKSEGGNPQWMAKRAS